MDLHSAASAVARLPFAPDKLVELLSSVEPVAANDPADQDHSTFWLVVADQFAKKAIASELARSKALAIIDAGSDLTMWSKLGMDAAGLGKRREMLADLRLFLTAGSQPAKPRRVLKKPQPLIMQVGEVLVYPTSRGQQINPYFASKDRIVPAWRKDGWSAAIVAECGRVFDFLAWYRPLTIPAALMEKPEAGQIRSMPLWVLRRPGTCSPVQFKKMEIEKIGKLSIDFKKFDRRFPGRPTGVNEVVSDISIANQLNVGPDLPSESIHVPGQPPNRKRGRQYPAISGLDEILS